MALSEDFLPKLAVSPYFGTSILRKFRDGAGTMELAKLYNMPESAIYNALHRARAREPVGPIFEWTAERERQLKKLWPTHTALEIAKILGAPSRSAVCGKANRMGLIKV